MQMVTAKCVTPAWDSVNAISYVPGGGPLPEGLYEIDRSGPLSTLKLGSTYVFEFDRNAGPGDKPHDYTCKKCGATKDPKGKKFTLATLGTHTKIEHKDDTEPQEQGEEEPAEDLSFRTCTICKPPKLLKTRHGLRLHCMKSHPHQPMEQAIEAETAVPA